MNRKTKIITLFNNKGGVGKTTLLYHLGYSLAKLDKKVLFVDLDPQCSLTAYLHSEERVEKSVSDKQTIYFGVKRVIEGMGDIVELNPIRKENKNVWTIIGDVSLSKLEDDLSSAWLQAMAGKPRGLRLISALFRIICASSDKHEIDYVLVDMAPNLGVLNKTILSSCDNFIIPVAPDLFSIRGLQNIGEVFKRWSNDWNVLLEKFSKLKESEKSKAEKELNFDIQKSNPKFLGLLNQNFNVYGKKKTKGWEYWSNKLNKEIEKNMILKLGKDFINKNIPINEKNYSLGEIKNYHSLAPISQGVSKPIFDLKTEDFQAIKGKKANIGGQGKDIETCGKNFKKIAEKIIEFSKT